MVWGDAKNRGVMPEVSECVNISIQNDGQLFFHANFCLYLNTPNTSSNSALPVAQKNTVDNCETEKQIWKQSFIAKSANECFANTNRTKIFTFKGRF